MHVARRRILQALIAGAGLATSACRFPRDARGTLDHVHGRSLRVGVSSNSPWTIVGSDGDVSGTEPALVREYASTLSSSVSWRIGAESILADDISKGELDIVIGGLTSKSPWTDTMALTRPYTSITRDDGSTADLVMGVQLGENALLVSLEKFLGTKSGELS